MHNFQSVFAKFAISFKKLMSHVDKKPRLIPIATLIHNGIATNEMLKYHEEYRHYGYSIQASVFPFQESKNNLLKTIFEKRKLQENKKAEKKQRTYHRKSI